MKTKGSTLGSDSLPKVKLKFGLPPPRRRNGDTPPRAGGEFKYAGGQTFILYGVARAAQHFYVDAGKDGRISSFYWVQFEG